MIKTLGIFLFFLVLNSCSDRVANKLDEAPRPKVKIEDKISDVTLTFEPKVDILFVIDNSGSMGSHQYNLARQVNNFSHQITKNVLLDYHIGVLTSDMEKNGGELIGAPPWVDKTTINGSQVLAERLQPGSNGYFNEMFFEPLVASLESPLVDGVNKGFYRSEAFLAVVFITDAAIEGPLSARATYDFLMQLKQNDKEKLAAYAAIIPPENPNNCATDNQWNERNLNRFIEFLNFFDNTGWGKTYFDLCSQTFGEDLARIGEDLENRIDLFIPLKEYPVVETLKVRYGHQDIPPDESVGWSYNAERVGILLGKGLVLDEQPGAELIINYIPAKLEFPKN